MHRGGRPRTGQLILRKSGYYARFVYYENGERRRVSRALRTHDRDQAHALMARLIREGIDPVRRVEIALSVDVEVWAEVERAAAASGSTAGEYLSLIVALSGVEGGVLAELMSVAKEAAGSIQRSAVLVTSKNNLKDSEQRSLLDAKGVAELLRVSVPTMRSLNVPHLRIGSQRRYDPAQVLAFFEEESNRRAHVDALARRREKD